MTIEQVRDTYRPQLSVQEQSIIRKDLDIKLNRHSPTKPNERGKLYYTDLQLRKVLQKAGFRKITDSDVGKYIHDEFIS